jgi:RimJ/RimL family protein N-acetyltransferase
MEMIMQFAGTARPPRMMRLRHRYRARTAASGSQARLRDGAAVLIRPIRSSDAPLLAEGFARLSARSRWMRFLTVKNELTPAELRYLTDIDHRDHEALGALSRDGRGVGVARYVRDKTDPRAAEIAITIADDWQGRGLGRELLTRLSRRARQEGIRRFTALVAADNAAMIALLRTAGGTLADGGSDTVEFEIVLAPAGSARPRRAVSPLAGSMASPAT